MGGADSSPVHRQPAKLEPGPAGADLKVDERLGLAALPGRRRARDRGLPPAASRPQAVLNGVVGDPLFSIDDLVLHIEPVPSLADALYLPGYPVLAAGLALLALSRSAGRDVAGVIDGAIIAIGF